MRVGFIGTGNMGGAILRGYRKAHPEDEVFAYRRNAEKLQEICRETGAFPCESAGDTAAKSDILLLGIKPGGFPDLLPQVAACPHKPVYVSMAAGISIRFLESFLGKESAVIRIMPNTPAMIGLGMTGVCRNANVTDGQFEDAMKIFRAVGKAEEVDEEMIHTVIGVSGSSPAYTYMYIEALIEAAVRHGMSEEKAKIFAAQSVLGAAQMVLESSDSPEQLCINVCSPGGTTIEAVNVLKEKDFSGIVGEAFDAAAAKSREMTK